ncbi:MAG TPA: Gmad2 immunoglobulin-like domain-containing protein [Ktedonobacteraceae bacterium]|nr:Gmad2 immunoglobulin-like domain-containing protein [Ktedonobacteraceae bacterium]
MQKKFVSRGKCQGIAMSLLLLLTALLTACSMPGSGGGGNASSSPTAAATSSAGTSTPAPGVSLGIQPCPTAVSVPSHWDAIIPTQANVSKVESVSCANLMGNPSLQALVIVRFNGTGSILDLYVYKNITDASPVQVFKLQGLSHGAAKISNYNTVITGEVDQNSSVNTGKANAFLTQDLFREFKWADGAGTFVPVSFPGIFPDLTRYQAEADQAQVNQGQDPWKLNAETVSKNLTVNLLKWSANVQTTIVSGGGQRDADAVVNVKSTSPGGNIVKVTLSRLEGNANGGIWEATAVESTGMSITAPQDRDRLTSPFAVKGTGNAFEGKIGKVVILDHLYNDIGHADANGATGNGPTTFSTNVSYSSTFKNGTQEGIVQLYSRSNADGSIAGVVMIKELLSA